MVRVLHRIETTKAICEALGIENWETMTSLVIEIKGSDALKVTVGRYAFDDQGVALGEVLKNYALVGLAEKA